MIGLLKSSSSNPTARSIARLGLRWTPEVVMLLRRLSDISASLRLCIQVIIV
jgi:hypothetical protein